MAISILSWNICFGCMYSNENSVHDRTARTLAIYCRDKRSADGKNHCLHNVVDFINAKHYDFICLQEATNWETIFAYIRAKNSSMEYLHHKASKDPGYPFAELVTFYDSSRFKIDFVKADNLTPGSDGRPYHVLFFTKLHTDEKIVVINAHLPHGWNTNQLESKLSNELENCVDLSVFPEKSFNNIDEMPFNIPLFIDYVLEHNGKFNTIMMGDFNDANHANFYRGIRPFKNFLFEGVQLQTLVLNTTKTPPLTCCIGSGSLRMIKGEDDKYGDYALIDQKMLNFVPGYENITPSDAEFNYDAHVNPTSDHIPITSLIWQISSASASVGVSASASVGVSAGAGASVPYNSEYSKYMNNNTSKYNIKYKKYKNKYLKLKNMQ